MSILTTIGTGISAAFGFIKDIILPVERIIDNLHTSDEEKHELRNKLAELENAMQMKVIEYETKLMEAQSSIIQTEIKSDSWLTKTWRPSMMVFFATLLGMYWFDVTPANLTQETIDNLFGLLKIGIGGYIIGRSAQDLVPKVIDKFKEK